MNGTSFSGLRILVCNDDGAQAVGLKVMERIAHLITPDVWIVAPETDRSGIGPAVTLGTCIRMNEIAPRKFVIDGSPSDCVLIAVNHILHDRAPDIILSGVNHGHNMAAFVRMSGTAAIAATAAQMGIKSFAISQDCAHGAQPTFAAAEHFLPGIIKKLYTVAWPNHMFINITVPDVSVGNIRGAKATTQGVIDIDWNVLAQTDPRKKPYFWFAPQWRDISEDNNADVKAVRRDSYISVTPISCIWTMTDFLPHIDEVL